MAEVLLTHAVSEAEEAIESGNYGGAIEACQRILGQFPEFAGAHRIMGDAYAEQGELDAARESYQRTLERDPQSIPAHLGLGIIAEDAGELESALAYYQVAWEIDPRRRDLREHVSRISQQLYGSDGRLYLTRAALASLHFHAGRWDRAVSEAAQVLQEFPTRLDVQVRLAEALWRRGDDEQAREVSRSILQTLPSAVVPLLILADIHRHEGDETSANEFRAQARDIDPDGVRAADLIMIGLDEQAEFLAVDSIPTIDDTVVHEEPARYAPAPDFMSSEPERPDFSEQAPDDVEISPAASGFSDDTILDSPGVQPFRWDDISDEDLETSDLGDAVSEADEDSGLPSAFTLPTDDEIDQARPSDEQATGYTSMLESLDLEGVQPFDPGSGQDASDTTRDEGVDLAFDDVLDDASMPTDEEIDQARPSDVREPGFTEMLDSLDAEGMQPFDPFRDEQHTPEPPATEATSPEPVEDPFDLSPLSDEEIEGARPGGSHPAGFTGMLNEFDAEGLQPFDFTEQSIDDLLPEEIETPDESHAAEDDLPPAEEEPFDLDWSRVDKEIEEAIPGDMPSGYTDELRDLDEFGLEPFDFSDTEASAESADVEPEPFDAAGFDEDVDLDQLTTDWSIADEVADDSQPEPELPIDEFDSIDVIFDDEDMSPFAETERLRPDDSEESEPDLTNDVEFDDLQDDASDASSLLGERFDQLVAGVESAGADWPVSATSDDDETDELFAETLEAFHQLGELSETTTQPPEAEAATQFASNSIALDRLGLDEALIERARQAKQRLIEQRQITGTQQFSKEEATFEAYLQAVEADPLDIDSRIALASALVDEQPDEALEQFRWVYRNAPERGTEVVEDLVRLIVVMREREVSVHRLLGALYRRHGDWRSAATHYEESLAGKWRRLSE